MLVALLVGVVAAWALGPIDAFGLEKDGLGMPEGGVVDYNCGQYEDCTSCINAYVFGCGWCAFSNEKFNKGECIKVVGSTDDTKTCGENDLLTYHDPHLYGDHCCFESSGSCDECLTGHGYCQYCGAYEINGETQPLCYHAKSASQIDQQCKVPIDKTACCSSYKESCNQCLKQSVCSYCYYNKECLYSSTGSNIPEGWCMGGENGDQSGIVEHCCEASTCYDCYEEVFEEEHTWNPNSPSCVWCVDVDSVETIIDPVDGTQHLKTSGTCVPPLESVCPAVSIDEKTGKEVHKQMVLLGSDYCDDPCYMGATDCSTCSDHKTFEKSSCVWVDNVEYPSVSVESLIPIANEFCVAGSISGPASDTLIFSKYQALSSLEFKGDYYYGICSITGNILLTIIIVVAIFVFIAVVATIVIVSKVRQHKLKALVRKAEAKADAEIGEMIDIRDPNALFKLWQEEVPWEDDFENDRTMTDTSDNRPPANTAVIPGGVDNSGSSMDSDSIGDARDGLL